MNHPTSIALVGTFGTKHEPLMYLRARLQEHGLYVISIDAGTQSGWDGAEIRRDEVARAAGSNLEEVGAATTRDAALAIMADGVVEVVKALHRDGRLDGIIAAGGAGNLEVASRAMRSLPFGLPKILVTTLASGNTRGIVGSSDIVLFNPVVDIAGMNPLLRQSLTSAAAAMHAMSTVARPEPSEAPAVFATMFGITTPCVSRLTDLLAEKGYEPVVFHTTGSGGEAMERMMGTQRPAAVFDVTTTELSDEAAGGICSAGPDRLTAAGSLGIPQIVVPGAIDTVNFGELQTVPERYRNRVLHRHSSTVTLMRSNEEENRTVARDMADKLNKAQGPVTVVIPGRGFSMLDQEGGPFWDPAVDAAFTEELTAALGSGITVLTPDMHINDPSFADILRDVFDTYTESR